MEPGIKTEMLKQCRVAIDKKVTSLQQEISELQKSANEETKSSAGDKYETGRAMAQLEIEKLATTLNQFLKQKNVLESLAVEKDFETAQPGAVVETTQGRFFISVSAGNLVVEGEQFTCISADSPIAMLLKGKRIGDVVTFNRRSFTISNVF